MTIIAQDTSRYSNLVKWELEPSQNFSHELVEVADNATLVQGSALGVVTATGAYKESVATATDGSQNPIAVVVDAKPIATSTTAVEVIARTARVSEKALVLDASFDDADKKAKAYQSLATKDILVDSTL